MLGKLPECQLLKQRCALQTQRRSWRAVNDRLRAIDFTREVSRIRQRSIAGRAVHTFTRVATQAGRAHKEHNEPTREEPSRRPHNSSMADPGHLGPPPEPRAPSKRTSRGERDQTPSSPHW